MLSASNQIFFCWWWAMKNCSKSNVSSLFVHQGTLDYKLFIIIRKRVMLHPQNNLEYFYKQTFIKSYMVQNFGACLWSCFNSYSSRNMIGHITYYIWNTILTQRMIDQIMKERLMVSLNLWKLLSWYTTITLVINWLKSG